MLISHEINECRSADEREALLSQQMALVTHSRAAERETQEVRRQTDGQTGGDPTLLLAQPRPDLVFITVCNRRVVRSV